MACTCRYFSFYSFNSDLSFGQQILQSDFFLEIYLMGIYLTIHMRKLFKRHPPGEWLLNPWATASVLVMNGANGSWYLAGPKGHRLLGRLILLWVSCRGLIGLWTWPLLSRGSKPESTTITPAPWKGWGARPRGRLGETSQSQHYSSKADIFSPLQELLRTLQAFPSPALPWSRHCPGKPAKYANCKIIFFSVWLFLNPQAAAKDQSDQIYLWQKIKLIFY